MGPFACEKCRVGVLITSSTQPTANQATPPAAQPAAGFLFLGVALSDIVDEMRAELIELRHMIVLLDEQLRPYFRARDGLQRSIIETFPNKTVDDGIKIRVSVTAYTRDGIGERRDLIAELDRLNEVNGPIVKQRRNLKIESDGLEKAIERILHQRVKKPQRQFEFVE